MNSRFTDIFTARKGNPSEEPTVELGDEQSASSPTPLAPIALEASKRKPPTKAATADTSTQATKQRKSPSERSSSSAPPSPTQTNGKKPGRPPGKRSDPAYVQVTAYLRRVTYSATQIALIKQDQSQEFSELVEELLAQWLKSNS